MTPSLTTKKAQRKTGKPEITAVVKMLQSISAEIDPDKLIDLLLARSMKYSGATKGVFLLFQDDVLQVVAEATVMHENIFVSRQAGVVSLINLPESIVNEVVQRREGLIFVDPSLSKRFSSDDYFLREKPRSVLCFPLLKEEQLVGVIYLENGVTPHGFTSNTLDFLNYLAAQGAISLENARIYESFSQHDKDTKVAEADLQKQLAHLHEVFDYAPVAMALCSNKAEVLRINREFTALFGFESSEIVGRNAYEMIVPEEKQRDLVNMLPTLANRHSVVFETIRKKKNGELFNVSIVGGRIGLDKAYTIYRDITERVRSEESFRTIVEMTPECVKVVARDGTLLLINSAGLAMLGLSIDFVVGQCMYEFIAPEDRIRYREFHERVCAGERGFLAFDIINALGERRHMDSHAAPMPYRDGSTVQLSVTRDITQRKQAEENLRRSEAYLAEAQKLSRTGSFGWNVSTDKHYWSDETFRIFGYDTSTKITLQAILERIHPSDSHLQRQAEALAAEGKDLDYECRLLMPDGKVKHVHVVAHFISNQPGFLDYVGAVMDVTVTRVAEEALRRGQAELAHVTRVSTLGELAASIAHEVSQPLAAMVINGNASLRWLKMLDADSEPLAETREAVQRIVRDGHQAAEIVARIRNLFKKVQPTMEPLDINQTLREVVVIPRYEIDKRKVKFEWKLASDLPRILGDRVQLQQVVLNLILNAIEAMSMSEGTGAELSVQTQLNDKREVIVSIRDNGPGIEDDCLEKIFEAFHTTKAAGLGMGLSISRTIVESHSGKLWVTRNEGPGLTFHFSLATNCE